MTKYTFWQRLKVRLFGGCYLEYRTKPGWRASLPFYLVKCQRHGYFEDYVHGFEGFYTQYLSCPTCSREGRMEYRSLQPRGLDASFKKFVVKFRDEVWHVSAPSAEDAKRIFASEFLLTSPRPEEVTVEEVVCR